MLSIEDYDFILDALDNEDTNTIIKCFQKFNIKPDSKLLDAPRYGNDNIEINTYLDYIIFYNLTDIIDIFIDELNLEVTDEIIASSITLYNHNTYKYFCDLGYIPDSLTFITAVEYCCSTIVYSLLENDNDLINSIQTCHVKNMFDCRIDEETAETIRVLFNFGIKNDLFTDVISKLKMQNFNRKQVEEESENDYDDDNNSQDVILEIIDIIENNCI